VRVDLTATPQALTLQVLDDGRGLAEGGRWSGLLNMRRRAERHGGWWGAPGFTPEGLLDESMVPPDRHWAPRPGGANFSRRNEPHLESRASAGGGTGPLVLQRVSSRGQARKITIAMTSPTTQLVPRLHHENLHHDRHHAALGARADGPRASWRGLGPMSTLRSALAHSRPRCCAD
jgi:hypothetical protein